MTGTKSIQLQPDRAQWEVSQQKLGASFLQSSAWGDFQEKLGHQTYYLLGDGWSCLLIVRKAAIGKYLFAPYGPTLASSAKLTVAIDAIKTFAKDKKADWLRIEPICGDEDLRKVIIHAGGRPAPKNVEPSLTRIVDLSVDEETLLSSLSQTTRNIIRRSRRERSLSFRTSLEPADMKIFSRMLDTVASRKHVGFYDHSYYLNQAQVLMPISMMRLELAYDGTRPVGAAVIHEYGHMATYTYASSLPQARDKNVSALLLWQSMLNAKAGGMDSIDLFGIAPDDAPSSHPWAGFSSFKKKFGGRVTARNGTWDIPLTGRYRIYRAGLKARRVVSR